MLTPPHTQNTMAVILSAFESVYLLHNPPPCLHYGSTRIHAKTHNTHYQCRIALSGRKIVFQHLVLVTFQEDSCLSESRMSRGPRGNPLPWHLNVQLQTHDLRRFVATKNWLWPLVPYLHKKRVGLVVDGVRVVELAVVPQDLPHWRVLLGYSKHPLWIAAVCQQLPVQGRCGEINKFRDCAGHLGC